MGASRAKVPFSGLKGGEDGLVKYVNTWNHKFSEEPLLGAVYVPFHVEEATGCREEAERKCRAW